MGISFIFIARGIKEGNFVRNYKEVFIVEAGFVGTIMAIFFTLVTIPIQNVITRYSPVFFKKVARNKIYIISFTILALILIYNLFVIILGGNQFFTYTTGILGLLTIIILGVLILETFHILDVRNLIRMIANDAIKDVRKNIKTSEFWRRFRYKIKGMIYGKVFSEAFRKPFEVEEWVTESLKSNLDPIVSATNRAILEDQFEIAQSGYGNLARVIHEYLKARKDFETYDDKILYYANDQLIDYLKISIKQSSPRYVSLIADSAFKIAEGCLIVKHIRSELGENHLLNPFISLLKRIALSEEIFKETSYAPSRAIGHLRTLGVKLVENGFSDTSEQAGEHIGEISRKLVKTDIHFHDILCQQANIGLMAMMSAGFKYFERIIDRDSYFQAIRHQIIQFFREYLTSKRSPFMKDIVVVPFYGSLSQTYTFSRLFFTALNRIYQDPREWHQAKKEIEEIVNLIETIGDLAIKNEKHYDLRDLNTQIYKMSIIDVIFLLGKNIEKNRKKYYSENMPRLLEIQLTFLSNILEKKGSEIVVRNILDEIFSLLGIVFYYKYKEGKTEFDELIEKIVKTTSEIIAKADQEIKNDRNGQLLCRYLRLTGSWYMHFDRNSSWIENLARQVAETQHIIKPPKILSNREVNYPMGIHLEWSLKRVEEFNPSLWNEFNEFLNDEESKKQFDDLVESFRKECSSLNPRKD